MNVVDFLEHPLPVLDTDIDKIVAVTPNVCEGAFTVKNTGGGLLSGRILSHSGCISFSPEEFSAKKITISYRVDLSARHPGETIKTSAVIMSNGGERTLPVIIKAEAASLIVKPLAAKINDLKGFCKYAGRYPEEARRVFASKAFEDWLLTIGYPHMDAYGELLRDANKERALDNFLILNRLKKKARINTKDRQIQADVNPYAGEVADGAVTFTRTAWGYVNATIIKENDTPWLTLDTYELSARDFGKDNTAAVNYFIDPKRLTGMHDKETLIIKGGGADIRIDVSVRACPPFVLAAQKESCAKDERGFIAVQNNTGADLTLDITANEPYFKFEKTRHTVGHTAKIPFEVKISGLVTAQYTFRKRPGLPVTVTVSSEEHSIKRTLKFMVELP